MKHQHLLPLDSRSRAYPISEVDHVYRHPLLPSATNSSTNHDLLVRHPSSAAKKVHAFLCRGKEVKKFLIKSLMQEDCILFNKELLMNRSCDIEPTAAPAAPMTTSTSTSQSLQHAAASVPQLPFVAVTSTSSTTTTTTSVKQNNQQQQLNHHHKLISSKSTTISSNNNKTMTTTKNGSGSGGLVGGDRSDDAVAVAVPPPAHRFSPSIPTFTESFPHPLVLLHSFHPLPP